MTRNTRVPNPAATRPTLSHRDRLLHEPAQRQVLRCLSAVESADPIFLVRQTGLPPAELSRHMAHLYAAGCITRDPAPAGASASTMLSLSHEGRLTNDINHRWRLEAVVVALLCGLPTAGRAR